jgi:Family of unknown function (DUF6116)
MYTVVVNGPSLCICSPVVYDGHPMGLSNETERWRWIERFASRLKFPYLFFLTAAIFLLDLLIPDAIPFVDEILLGLVAVLLGTWKNRKSVEPGRPMKNVTPR